MAYGAVGIDFNVDHLAVKETDPFDNMLRTKRFPLLWEDAGPRRRNAVLADALTAVVCLGETHAQANRDWGLGLHYKEESDGVVQPERGAHALGAALRKMPATAGSEVHPGRCRSDQG